jgi:hypothetical protein
MADDPRLLGVADEPVSVRELNIILVEEFVFGSEVYG